MNSESKYELVEITHFINPSLFWINRIEDIDSEYEVFYRKLQAYAQHAETYLPKLKKICLVKDPVKNIWARGVIELDIDLKVAHSLKHGTIQGQSYRVWLIDEGRPVDVTHAPRKLTPEFREKETKCERCILFGVTPATQEYNIEKEIFEKRRVSNWQMSARTIIKELISNKHAQVYFNTRKYLENVVIGDLRVVLKNKIINIAEYLVEKEVAYLDEEYFIKVQRHIILSPSCRVKTPSEIQSPYSGRSTESSRPVSRQSLKTVASNTSSRSISNQSQKDIPKPTTDVNLEDSIDNDLNEIDDVIDSDPPLTAFTKRTTKTEFQVCSPKPVLSDSSSSENEVNKLQSNIQLDTSNELRSTASENDSLILNRTAGRGSRRSIKQQKGNTPSPRELSETTKSLNESLNFTCMGRGSRQNVKSPVTKSSTTLPDQEITPDKLLSVRKKLFNSINKLDLNTSGKTPAKKLFTDVASINTIDHTLSENQDAEFYDNTDSDLTGSEDNSSKTVKEGIKYICNKRNSEMKSCVAVIKNVDEYPETHIVEEEILGMTNLEDDAAFLERFKQKEAKKLLDERRLLEQLTKKDKIELNNPSIKKASEDVETTVEKSTLKPNISKLLKKLKIKSSSNKLSPVATERSTSSSSRHSSSFDSSSRNNNASLTSSDDITDNEICGEIKKNVAETTDSTWSWPKVDVPPTDTSKLNIIPAGIVIEQAKKKSKRKDLEVNECVVTTETFLERKIKTFQGGRNIKIGTSMPVLNMGGATCDQFTPHLLIHSLKKITPLQNVGQAYLHSDIQNVLTSMNIIELQNLQSYVWPAINRGENLVAIWSKYVHNKPDELSCMMFLPILCNNIIQNNYDDLEKFDGPIVLILCAHKTAARIIYEKTMQLLRATIMREKLEHERKMRDKRNTECTRLNTRAYLLLDNIDILRGDIVISTPKCFMARLNQMRGYATEFRRLCHLVIDDADIITERYSTELNQILIQCQNTLDRRRNATRNVQLVLTGEKWTNGILDLCKKTPIKPAICIEPHIEAAIYAKINMNLQFIKSEAKIEVLFDLINKKIPTFKTILMCNKYSECEEVIKFLNTKGIEALSLQKHVTGTEIKHIFNLWNNATPGAYQLLVLTDDILADISINTAMWLIHYTLPRTWTHFSNRFYSLSANYQSFVTISNKNAPVPKVHIFIDETHIEVIPRMINFLERLSNKENCMKLLPLKEAAIIAKEERKLKNKDTSTLCYLLLSTGICPNEFRCKKRHILVSHIDSPKLNIEIGSIVKLKFIELCEGVHFSARLIDAENNYKILAMDLANYYREHNETLTTIDVNKMYACKITDTLFERCKIIEKSTSRISRTSSPKEYFKVHLVDTGKEKIVKLKSLRHLPDRFTADVGHAFDIFIANVKPHYNEIIWDIENKSKMENILRKVDIHNPDVFITGDVKLTIGNCIWIDNIQVIERFTNSGAYVEKLNLTYELLRENIIEKNPMHIQNLTELCTRGNIDLKYAQQTTTTTSTIENIHKIRMKKPELKLQNAYLEVGTDFEKVFFLSTDSDSRFYLGRYEFNKLLTQLLDDITKTVTNGLYPQEIDIRPNNYCLAWMSQDNMHYRVQIKQILDGQQVKCFLIDEGYVEIFNQKDLKPIMQWMLTQLPAQSISCRLFGVQYKSEILEQFEDVYDTLWARCVQRDPDGTHAVFLIKRSKENNIILNYLALNENGSSRITSEVLQEDDFILQEIEDSDNDFDDNNIETINTENNNILNSVSDEEHLLDDKYDIQISDPMLFFKGLLHIEGPLIQNQNTLEANNEKSNNSLKQLEYYNKIIKPHPTEEVVVCSTLLPTVLWHQTNNTIVLKIQLTGIKEYELNTTANSLYFRTDCDGKNYELNLSLYENIDDLNCYNQAKGLKIVVKLTKLIKGKSWPRLLKSTQRFRNIKLNFDQELSGDEADKKFTPFLQEFSKLSKDDDESDDDELRYEIGSDTDNSSDWVDDDFCDV